MNYSNNKEISTAKELLQENENIIKYTIEMNRKRNLIEHCKIKSEILILGNQLLEIIENQKKITRQLEDLKTGVNEFKTNDGLNLSAESENAPMSVMSSIRVPNLVIECKLDTAEDAKDEEYDELLNECYDAIPLNNIKKNTGLSWIFK